jgi:predicted DNA-binding protein (MmcQ/YjbR family)
MDIEYIHNYVMIKDGVTEGFPFGEDTLVFKVAGKIFLLIGLDNEPLRFNVKCNPEMAIELREEYPDNILPGYHMNKKHWNTIIVNNRLSSKLILQMIDNSYNLVKPKKKQ